MMVMPVSDESMMAASPRQDIRIQMNHPGHMAGSVAVVMPTMVVIPRVYIVTIVMPAVRMVEFSVIVVVVIRILNEIA